MSNIFKCAKYFYVVKYFCFIPYCGDVLPPRVGPGRIIDESILEQSQEHEGDTNIVPHVDGLHINQHYPELGPCLSVSLPHTSQKIANIMAIAMELDFCTKEDS